MKKHLFLSLILALTASVAAVAQESLTFAYAKKDATMSLVGTNRIDNYDVAIAVTNPSMYGMVITSIEFPVVPSAKLTNLSAWISKNLKLEQQGAVKVNVPDISIPLEMPTEGNGVKWVTVNLDEPYVIPEGGVYVGYSLAVGSVDNTDVTKYPIVATPGSVAGSFYLHTTRTYKTWEDRSSMLNATSMIQVSLKGSTVPANAARLGAIPQKYVTVGTENTIDVMVYNIGTEAIKTIDYTSRTDNGNSVSMSKTLARPIEPVFGSGSEVEFVLPEFTNEGVHDVSIEIDAINGEKFSGSTAKGKIHVALFVPKHSALVEEYTGMWCGNCPRGYVAMEYMNEHYPDFIGIAYHNNDVLAMETGDPGIVDGYPGVSLERKNTYDPYYAIPTFTMFSLPDVWKAYCSNFTPAEVEVKANWNEESRKVEATSTVNWAIVPDDAESANYRIEYVLMADGLSNPSWYQANYYANGSKDYPELMDVFTYGKEYVFGLVYNDVAILTSGFKGVKGSIPSIKVGEPTNHSFTFDTNEAYNVGGTAIPFDKNKLRVVAIVLKGAGPGEVVNAAKCDVVVSEEAGIGSLEADDANVVATEYYDLCGRKKACPQQGIYIQLKRYADGSTIVQKRMK